uniref:Uncharacterized protein n=1 Tax=Romanomermis culicivorax TaxID=13658 RepID=A0A915IMW0_ROMCU
DLLLKRLPAGRSVVSSGAGGQQQGLEPSADDALDLNKWASDEKEFELETSQGSLHYTLLRFPRG